MLKILDKNKIPLMGLVNYKDLCIEGVLELDDKTLSFSIPSILQIPIAKGWKEMPFGNLSRKNKRSKQRSSLLSQEVDGRSESAK